MTLPGKVPLAWLLLVTVLVLTAFTMWGSKRFVHYEGLSG